MVTITDYAIKYDPQKDVYCVVCRETLFCPLCGGKLSGYDTRRRHIVDYAGNTYWHWPGIIHHTETRRSQQRGAAFLLLKIFRLFPLAFPRLPVFTVIHAFSHNAVFA